MPLNFKSMQAELKGLNVRKEGPEDNREIAIDLKFEGETDGKILKDLFGADHIPPFWLDNPDKDSRYHGITGIGCSGEFEGHELKFAKQHLYGAKVHKIAVLPRPHRMVSIDFTVSIKHPAQTVINAMTEMIRELGDVEVRGERDLFSDDEDGETVLEFPGTNRTEEQTDLEGAIGQGPDRQEPEEDDEEVTYKKAVDHVISTQKVSIARIGREMKISANRAARIVERMQSEGIISAPGVNSIREVLKKPEEAEA